MLYCVVLYCNFVCIDDRLVGPGKCSLSKESGVCRGHSGSVTKWFYNMESGLCEKFIYSLCGGNANRYKSKDECEEACPVAGGWGRDVWRRRVQSQVGGDDMFGGGVSSGRWVGTRCLEEACPVAGGWGRDVRRRRVQW